MVVDHCSLSTSAVDRHRVFVFEQTLADRAELSRRRSGDDQIAGPPDTDTRTEEPQADMVLAERSALQGAGPAIDSRNGRRSRGPSPNGHADGESSSEDENGKASLTPATLLDRPPSSLTPVCAIPDVVVSSLPMLRDVSFVDRSPRPRYTRPLSNLD